MQLLLLQAFTSEACGFICSLWWLL